MIRRRRPTREIAFSFDSFLDIIANVVGVIIRMILVVWVGARSYHAGMEMLPKPEKPVQAEFVAPTTIEEPLREEVAGHKRQLTDLEARLNAELRSLAVARSREKELQGQLASASGQRQALERQHTALERNLSSTGKTSMQQSFTLAELQSRKQLLMAEIHKLEKQPIDKKVLRYRTPVSQPVRAEEYHFECVNGRISFVNFPALLREIKRDRRDAERALRHSWQVSETTPAIGAFRLRYTLERQRGLLGSILETPNTDNNFSYALSEAVVEPVFTPRGENLEQALTPGSHFRQIVDGLDRNAVVTFWVYPDSFALFRAMRDYLYDHNVVVAGRPLPEGHPIVCSRNGSLSRGQ